MKRWRAASRSAGGTDTTSMRRPAGRWYDRVLYVAATVGLLVLLLLAPVALILVTLAACNVI